MTAFPIRAKDFLPCLEGAAPDEHCRQYLRVGAGQSASRAAEAITVVDKGWPYR